MDGKDLMDPIRVKFPNQAMGLGLHTESSHDRGENGAPKGLLAQL